MSLIQFFFSSTFIGIYQYFRFKSNIWQTWKKHCLSSSLTHFTGAGLAGIVYKVISYGDLAVTVISFLILSIAYINYRKMLTDIDEAITLVEHTEGEKRVIAEKHSQEMAVSLKQTEEVNEALRKSQAAFKHNSLHDSLTNLANRQQFAEKLKFLIDEHKTDPALSYYVLFIDIRRFKDINDTLGHTIGDKVLIVVAKRFLRCLRPTDLVARLGGDEFAIILRDLNTLAKVRKLARKIHNSVSQPFALSGNRIYVNLNIGIAPCDADYETVEEILRDADIAMHYAKEKNTGVEVFTKDLGSRFLERLTLETDLRLAVERGEFSMHYQPLIDLTDGEIIGFEALLRWNHQKFGLISPAKFIPIAEESGLIIPITIWILQETCQQLAKWQSISAAHKNLIISINISGKHLDSDELFDDVEDAIETAGVAPNSVKLEITESVAMENPENTIRVLNTLKRLGVQLSIDDFGTGYSSLNYLHRLPFDTLKIDRTFVYTVGESGENSEILRTIVALAKNLKMKIIAEGIETANQYQLLQSLGCDYGQGYFMAKPMPKEAAESLLLERRNMLPFPAGTLELTADGSDNLPVF